MKRLAGMAPLLLVAALVISACTKDAPDAIACPSVEVLPDLGQFTRFVSGAGRDATDVLMDAWIDAVGGKCALGDGRLLVDLAVRIGVRRGPATKTDSATVRYFVAIADRDRTVLSRQPFEKTTPFVNRKTVLFEDVLDLRIPLSRGVQTDAFTIYVGLELSEEELKNNRAKR